MDILGGIMPTARSISHKAKKARLSEKDNLESRLILFNAIPVYPKEVSTRALSKMTGLNIRLLLSRMSANVMVCEDNGMYCWPSEYDKKRSIFEYVNNAGGSDFL